MSGAGSSFCGWAPRGDGSAVRFWRCAFRGSLDQACLSFEDPSG